MLTLKRFEESDWYGFAGAQCFKNGDAPWIGDFEVHGREECDFVLVVDSTGVTIQGVDEAYFSDDTALVLWQLAPLVSSSVFGKIVSKMHRVH